MSKYLKLQRPEASWFDYPTMEDRLKAYSFSGQSAVGIVQRSQSELSAHQYFCRFDGEDGARPDDSVPNEHCDGFHLADQLGHSLQRQFLTNKPDIGWNPSVNKAITNYYRLMRGGATVDELDQEIKRMQTGECASTGVKFVSLSPSQATKFLQRKWWSTWRTKTRSFRLQ
jgi:hypothetical protein